MSSSEDGQPQTEAELEELFAELQLREVRYFHLSEQAEQIEESTTDTAERNAAWRDASAAWLWVESGIAKYGRLSDRDEGEVWKILSDGRDYGVVIWDLPWRPWDPDRMDWSFLSFLSVGEGYRSGGAVAKSSMAPPETGSTPRPGGTVASSGMSSRPTGTAEGTPRWGSGASADHSDSLASIATHGTLQASKQLRPATERRKTPDGRAVARRFRFAQGDSRCRA